MTVAMEILKRELNAQESKLEELQKEWKSTIEEGQRASRTVSTQVNHVDSIREALTLLSEADRARQEPGPKE